MIVYFQRPAVVLFLVVAFFVVLVAAGVFVGQKRNKVLLLRLRVDPFLFETFWTAFAKLMDDVVGMVGIDMVAVVANSDWVGRTREARVAIPW